MNKLRTQVSKVDNVFVAENERWNPLLALMKRQYHENPFEVGRVNLDAIAFNPHEDHFAQDFSTDLALIERIYDRFDAPRGEK